MAVGTMIARLIAKTGQFHGEMDQVKKRLERTEQVARTASAAMAAGLVAVGVAAGFAGAASIKMAAQWEQSEIAFTTLLRSGEKAKEFLGQLEDFASATPFELPGIMDASRKLLAFGWQAESVIPTMTAIGDAVAAIGGGEQSIASITRALGQMKTKGVVGAQEMTVQLAEAGIPAWRFLAEYIGTSQQEAMRLVERRAISAGVGISAILKGMAQEFGGAMETQSKSLIGLWSTLRDEVRTLSRGFGAFLVEALNIKPVLGGITAAFRQWANVIRTSETAAQGFGQLMRGMFPPETRIAVIALSGAILGTLIPVFKAAAKAIWTATLALKGFMLKGAAIAVTAYLVYKAWSDAGGGIAAVSVFMIRMAAAVVGVFGMLSPAIRSVATQMQAYANSVAAASRPAQAMQEQADDLKRQQDNLAKTGIDAAKAQDALGKSTEEAAKKAGGNVMAFDQVHRLQEQMAETAGAGLDAGVAGAKFVAPNIAAPKIDFDLGPLAEMGKSWDRLKASMEAIQPVMEAVGYVISGVVAFKVGQLIVKLGILGYTSTINTAKVVAAWASKAAAAVISTATQIGAKVSLIAKWAALSLAAGIEAAKVAGAWLLMKAKALISLAAQMPVFLTIIAKWAAMALAATVNATKMAAAWIIAMGPKAWIAAAIIGLAVLVIANWERIKEATARIWGSVVSWLATTWGDIRTRAGEVWTSVAEFFSGLWAGIGTAARGAWTGLSDWLVGLWGGIQSSAVDIWEGIRQAVVAPMTAVTGWLSTSWEATRQGLSTVWGAISTAAVAAWATLRTRAGDLWEGIRQSVVSPIERVRDWLANAWQTIRTTAINAFTSLRDGVLGIWNGLASGISDIVGRILSPINAIVEAVQNALAWLSRLAGTPTGGTAPRPVSPLMPLPPVPHLAAGGIVRRPTLAMIGEGRHSEAVVPLKPGMNFGGDNADAIGAAVYKAVRDAIRVSRIEQGRESERQEISIELDGAKLGRALVPLLRREGQRTGVVVT